MEHALIPAPLPDRETFARVWQRVMPDPDRSPLRLRSAGEEAPSGDTTSPPLLVLLEGLFRSGSDCQRQARRGGPAAGPLSELSAAQRQSLRQFSPLFFLRTGTPFRPAAAEGPLLPLPLFLRQQYLLCRRLEVLAEQLAREEQDPCFFRILQEFRPCASRRAARFYSLLFQFLPVP